MKSDRVLFSADGKPKTPQEIYNEIARFKNVYINATYKIIQASRELDKNGEVFVYCTAIIPSKFKMTRNGPFKGVKITASGNVVGGKILLDCWYEIGSDLIKIHDSVFKSDFSRDRYLLELDREGINELIADIWKIFKRLLPFTMGKSTFGLVAASKILFSVLPEIVLPIDTKQWLNVFKTVDIGDVINQMTSEIIRWENDTGNKLKEMDRSGRLTTLPSVYNVMAMAARLD